MFDQFKNLKDLAGLMGNREELQQKMQQMQEELAQTQVEAEAGGGAVRVTANGKLQVEQVRIDPAMLSAIAGEGQEADREMVEELIASATNAALTKAQETIQSQMSQLAGGIDFSSIQQMLGGGPGPAGPTDEHEQPSGRGGESS